MKDWNPVSESEFRSRSASDPVFRLKDFKRGSDGVGGLDILGTYHRRDSLVTIYLDSCLKASRRFNVRNDHLVEVVLIHELAHLVTHAV
jgi:hypothetical protein